MSATEVRERLLTAILLVAAVAVVLTQKAVLLIPPTLSFLKRLFATLSDAIPNTDATQDRELGLP